MTDELNLLLSGKGQDDYIYGMMSSKLFKKVRNKISALSQEDKDELMTALLFNNISLPDEDLDASIKKTAHHIISETLGKETRKVEQSFEVPQGAANVGGTITSKRKLSEGEEDRKPKKKKEEKKRPTKLSDLNR